MSAGPGIGILVIGDCLATGLLGQTGFTNIEEAPDARSALNRLHEKCFALVISDWKTTSMSGLELLRRMRQHPEMKRVRFLLITSSTHPQLADTARDLGADGLLMTPVTARSLKQAIDNAFG
jgi:two-component system chemotaxis response regulator CheY